MKRTLAVLILLVAAAGTVATTVEASHRLAHGGKVTASRCGKCGDGQCVKSCGETPQSCPVDCGAPAEQ